MPFNSYFRGKKVLITGDTGFKGSWLVHWLTTLGAEVHGLGLEPDTEPSLFKVLGLEERIQHVTMDIREPETLRQHLKSLRPEIVFHLAAQSLVRLSYRVPLETLETNFMGTANLLQAVSATGYTQEDPCVLVVVTSDKCYENREVYSAYGEDDPMGGHDIYSTSKGATELLVSAWRRAFFSPADNSPPAIFLATCRAGNVIGGGDWAADRLVADSIRSLSRGSPIRVRNPGSIRPWQHVQESLSGYLLVGAMLGTSGENWAKYLGAWNFGPGIQAERTVAEVCDAIVSHWGSGSWEEIRESNPPHEARFLKLAIDKAWHHLGWKPVWDFEKTVQETVSWYRLANECGYDTETMHEKTHTQNEQYMSDAAAQSLSWMEGT